MIKIKRHIKQEDALSCALLMICLDTILRNIENNNRIKTVNICTPQMHRSVKNKTGAYADDIDTINCIE